MPLDLYPIRLIHIDHCLRRHLQVEQAEASRAELQSNLRRLVVAASGKAVSAVREALQSLFACCRKD